MSRVRILLDTNILIAREDHRIIDEALQSLIQKLSILNIKMLLHPMIIDDIMRDSNDQRKKVSLSKLGAYELLNIYPECEDDSNFSASVGHVNKKNDVVDNALLCAVYKDSVHLLITEDVKIKKKAANLGIADRVLRINEANEYLNSLLPDDNLNTPPLIEKCPVHNLDINDPFFDDLKLDYDDFISWFKKISREGRECIVYHKNDKSIGALLIYKIEDEPLGSDPPRPASKRLKICTLKVEETGFRLGELLIKTATEYALRNNLSEIYLTHVSKGSGDQLEQLIANYGFSLEGTKGNENVWIKMLMISKKDYSGFSSHDPSYMWPSFLDGKEVQKIVVPILPHWHDRLFINFQQRQPNLFELSDFIIEGNAIEKAYLSHSPLKDIPVGSILLFYRSNDLHAITTLGVVKEIYMGMQDPQEILRIVRKRTVYAEEEIIKSAKKPLMVIIFTWNCYLDRPVLLADMINKNILKRAPQSMMKIEHEKYLYISRKGGLDERLIIN